MVDLHLHDHPAQLARTEHRAGPRARAVVPLGNDGADYVELAANAAGQLVVERADFTTLQDVEFDEWGTVDIDTAYADRILDITDGHESPIVDVYNGYDVGVYLSWDGANDGAFLPAGAHRQFTFHANGIQMTRDLWARAASAPGSGVLYATAFTVAP